MKCGWLQFLPGAHGAVRPFGLWEKCQEGPEENRGIPSLGCEDGTGRGGWEVPVTPGGKTKSPQVIFHGSGNSDTSRARQIRQMWKTSLCKITEGGWGKGGEAQGKCGAHTLPKGIHIQPGKELLV